MSDLSYTPTFRHKPWIDNVDRVKAAGPDGFNVRFEAIDSDLQQVSTVVTEIDTRLDQAESGPAPGTQRLLVPLDPTSNLIPGAGVWTCDTTGAIHPEPDLGSAASLAAGTMDVALPDQATLLSMRVIGLYQSAAAQIFIGLQRNNLFNIGLSANPIVHVTIAATGHGNPYDVTESVTGFATVDNTQFRYALLLTSSSVSNGDIITLDSVELTYTLP